ncbi:MAG: glycosyltransferase [Pyrinomonadaceae bacterium]
MNLSIIIPTFNRAASLEKTLLSLAGAERPVDFGVEVLVVDNNSTDRTPDVFEKMRSRMNGFRYEYLFEEKQGRSHALNAGIKRAGGDLLSGIDDDEEIEENWLVEVERLFRGRWDEIDFAGGKILPVWESKPPLWVEPLKLGVICWRDFGDEEWIYGPDTPMITGGHGIFKREVFEQIGLYDENVGAKGKGFISGEDEVFYDQLLSHGLRGVYHPKLVIYHFVPDYRLDKNYYRRWLFGVGVSRHLADTHYKPFEGAKLFGVPRWMYKSAVKELGRKIRHVFARNETESLAAENEPLVLAGYFYGRNLRGTWLDRPLGSIARKLFRSSER